jgi:trimeric autotransporter adhesin
VTGLARVLVFAVAMMGLYVAPSLARADAASDYGAAVLADSPVSYWRLNDTSGTTAVDQVGLNPGQITGATLGEPGPLAGSDSMRFDGSGDVNLGTDPSLRPPNNWTVEAWFKASASDTANCVNTYHSSGCALYAVHAFGLHLILDPQGHVYGFFDSSTG